MVFFDLYGTLIDIRTDERSETAWQALYEKLRGFGVEYESVEALRGRLRNSRRVRSCAKPIAVPCGTIGGIRYSPGLSFCRLSAKPTRLNGFCRSRRRRHGRLGRSVRAVPA